MAALLAAGCSSSGESTATVSVPTISFDSTSNVDTPLRPALNGFSFANFGSADFAGEDFAGSDLTKMFGGGPEVCATGTDATCAPTKEAAAWAQMVNESREFGHCEGFVVLALQRFADSQTPGTSTLATDSPVLHGIFRGFATQFLDSTLQEARAWRSHSVADVMSELVTSLKDGTPNYVLGLYNDQGGHAVLPYSVTFPEPNQALVFVYDSNWPNQERQVSIDLDEGTWVFSFDGASIDSDPDAWTGGKGTIDLSSLSAHTDGACPFCDSVTKSTGRTMLTIRAATPTWKLETAHGAVTPSGRAVPGTSVTRVRSPRREPSEWIVSVDPDAGDPDPGNANTGTLHLTLPKNSRAWIVTPRAIARAKTSNAAATVNVTDTSINTMTGTASLLLANGNREAKIAGGSTVLSLNQNGVPVSTNQATAPTTTVTGTGSSSTLTPKLTTTTTSAQSTTPSTAAATTTTLAATTTTTSPVNFTHSFRNGGTNGYTNSCSAEILDITISGATSVTSVTGSVNGTAMSNAMYSYGNNWTFYSVPSLSPGTYQMTVNVAAANGSRTRTLSITYDNDCNPSN